MAGLLWALVVILFALWLVGFAIAHIGSIIHVLLVLAVILLLYNLFAARRPAL